MSSDHTRRLVIPPISPAASAPLYQQIVEGVKREISEGRLVPGAALPSFRALAEDLLVSVITVKRAYEDLEHEGIIYRKQGLGTFVAEEGALRSREAKRVQAESLLRQALQEGLEAGLSEDDLLETTQRLLRERSGNTTSRRR
jgi:GntR family transcriptional regulator